MSTQVPSLSEPKLRDSERFRHRPHTLVSDTLGAYTSIRHAHTLDTDTLGACLILVYEVLVYEGLSY